MTTPAKSVDWERIETDYRLGLRPLRQIAESFGVTEGAIRKRAKRDDWTRDLSGKVRAKADDLVRKSEVRKEVRTAGKADERIIVEANASVIAQVKIRHRSHVKRAMSVHDKLLSELEAQKPGDVAFATRIDSHRKLVDAFRTLVGIEREAYGIVEAQKHEVTGANGGALETVINTTNLSDEQLRIIASLPLVRG